MDAYICEVGREKNQHNEWKWVLPYPNPCECTEVIMGGINTWTPIRPFVPTYAESPLLSNDVNAIREHYGLKCDTESKYSSESKTEIRDFDRSICMTCKIITSKFPP